MVEDGADNLRDILDRIHDINEITEKCKKARSDMGDDWYQLEFTGHLTFVQSRHTRGGHFSAAANSKAFKDEFDCDLEGMVDDINDGLADAMGPVLEKKAEINKNIIDMKDDTLKAINDSVKMMNDVIDMVDKAQEPIEKQRPTVSKYDDLRELLMYIFYALPFLPIVFGVIAAIFHLSVLFTISYCCFWFISVLMMLTLILILPLGSIMSDMCDFIDEMDDDWSHHLNMSEMDILDACMAGGEEAKLTNFLDIGEKFDEMKNVSFEKFSGLREKVDDSELLECREKVTNHEFFALSERQSIAELNAVIYSNNACGVADCKTNTDCLEAGCDDLPRYQDPWSRTCSVTLTDCKTPLNEEGKAVCLPHYYYKRGSTPQWEDMVRIVETLQMEFDAKKDARVEQKRQDTLMDLNGMVIISEEAKDWAQSAENEINGAAEILDPIIAEIDEILEIASCAFIGKRYREFHHVFCVDVVSHLADAALALAVIGILCLVSCCGSVCMVRKASAVSRFKMQARQAPGRQVDATEKEDLMAPESRFSDEDSVLDDVSEAEIQQELRMMRQVPPSGGSGRGAGSGSGSGERVDAKRRKRYKKTIKGQRQLIEILQGRIAKRKKRMGLSNKVDDAVTHLEGMAASSYNSKRYKKTIRVQRQLIDILQRRLAKLGE